METEEDMVEIRGDLDGCLWTNPAETLVSFWQIKRMINGDAVYFVSLCDEVWRK